jgi:hypothetical protein
MHHGYEKEVLQVPYRWQTILVKFIAENLVMEAQHQCQPSDHTSYKSLLARQMLQ